ncbi:hypothetical protein E6C67_08375 [Azospirillum sp. TSA2s]|uniref:HK97 family phage prohead protease n=1 Tax=Azospirillum sp. TSA2s TaxID=709810 RepID=UPI0010AB0AD0|nr:HK97 family phage prohead protease [Azospirillum sp. TSA2s]QCG93954.1 hypothetical protein E6C67_08375 [Azospirillum sp. TSA2s]
MPNRMTVAEFRDAATAGARLDASVVSRDASLEEVTTTDDDLVRFVISDRSVDSYNTTFNPNGWDLRRYLENPVVLLSHNSSDPAALIGNSVRIGVEAGQLVAYVRFLPADVNPQADTVKRMVLGGYLRGASVGFMPIDWKVSSDPNRRGGIDFTKQELLEWSVVLVPSNPNALVQARSAGIDTTSIDALMRSVEPEIIPPAAKKIGKRDLWLVGWLAQVLAELSCIEECAEWEADYEGDNSPVPGELTAALKSLGQTLINMTVEEVTELLAEEAEEEGEAMAMDRGARLRVLRRLCRLDAPALIGLDAAARHHMAGRRVTFSVKDADPVSLTRAGRVLSSSNEQALRDAHGMMSQACEMVRGVFDQAAPPEITEQNDEAERAAEDIRRREAEAIRLKFAEV